MKLRNAHAADVLARVSVALFRKPPPACELLRLQLTRGNTGPSARRSALGRRE